MEKCNGVWWYLKVEGKYRHHPSRGRLYMLDDAASRKSGNDDALRRCGRCTSPTALWNGMGPQRTLVNFWLTFDIKHTKPHFHYGKHNFSISL